jgi:hypothetical protein
MFNNFSHSPIGKSLRLAHKPQTDLALNASGMKGSLLPDFPITTEEKAEIIW